MATSDTGETLMDWVNKTPERQRAFAQEGLLLDATEILLRAMKRENMLKAELARYLGCSKAHVSEVLNGRRNMTLRTLSDFAGALGYEVKVRLVKK
jgi:antitoxin component HigA of HigAB toxin-antitoxin module